jgi:hypothetical protein
MFSENDFLPENPELEQLSFLELLLVVILPVALTIVLLAKMS